MAVMNAVPAKRKPAITGLLLAAGASTRLGQPKQLLMYQGQTLLSRAVSVMQFHCKTPVIVMLGAHAGVVQSALTGQSVKVVHNSKWQQGMATSICEGLVHVPAGTDGILIMLCDQPLITESDIGKLIDAWMTAPDQIVATGYSEDEFGVPAIFPAAAFPALSALQGDQGARTVIAAAQARHVVPLPAARLDIDTPADVATLRNHSSVN